MKLLTVLLGAAGAAGAWGAVLADGKTPTAPAGGVVIQGAISGNGAANAPVNVGAGAVDYATSGLLAEIALDLDLDREDLPYNAFIMLAAMILVLEIGDKTFLIAALMAMRNLRLVVFAAAWLSLVVMTVLSGVVGHALPALILPRVTQFMALGLFVVFGVKLLNEGLAMPADMGVDEEMAEVEEEIAAQKLEAQDLENGDGAAVGHANGSAEDTWYHQLLQNTENLALFVLLPVFIQVFVMTFLGEWGDRLQIATIAMAAGLEYWMVILGGVVGHGVCTAAACIGGKLLAKRISMRNVTLGGAVAFFVFAILYFYEAWHHEE